MTDRGHLQQSPRTFAARDAWMRAVLAATLPHAAVRIAIRIALYLHVGTGRCDPTYATLATESGIPQRTVYRLVPLLERAGWIARPPVRGRHANQYTLLNPATALAVMNPATTLAGMDAANTATGDTSTLPNRASNTANRVADKKRRTAKRTTKGEESDSRPHDASRDSARFTAAEIAAAFDRFWRVYPKRVAKLAARRAFAAAMKARADPDAIVAGAQQYARERAGQDARFTKHPATWLNAGCHEDEPAGGGVVIDNATGEPVAVAPRRSAPRTNAEVGAELLREIGDGKRS